MAWNLSLVTAEYSDCCGFISVWSLWKDFHILVFCRNFNVFSHICFPFFVPVSWVYSVYSLPDLNIALQQLSTCLGFFQCFDLKVRCLEFFGKPFITEIFSEL